MEQFIRFGVGIGLNDPSEIGRIAQYLQQGTVSKDVSERLAASRCRRFAGVIDRVAQNVHDGNGLS